MAEVNGLFVKLQDIEADDPLTEGRPFDGLVAGTFVDMGGTKFEFTDEDLVEIVANTRRAIEATRTESGEIAGLPIDARGHEGGDGAGFIVDVELVDGVIRFTPVWTKIGVELVGEKIRRWFSATIDTLRNLAIGGTLTNWPATRDNKTGEILLRPIELAQLKQPIYRADFQEEESLDDRVDSIHYAWWMQEETTDGPRSFVASGGVFEDYVIIDRSEGGFARVPYAISEDGDVTFADESQWEPVRREWVDMIRDFLRSAFRMDHQKPVDNRKPPTDPQDGNSKREESMVEKVAITELGDADKQAVIMGIMAELGLDPEAYAENGDLGESMAKLVDAAADRKVAVAVEQSAREAEIAQLSKDLTGGTESNAVGLPVKDEKLTEFLTSLSDEQRETAAEILSAILENGLTEFGEAGHSDRRSGGTKLPEKHAVDLKLFLGENEVATVSEYFDLNVDILGKQSDYDLSEFVKEETNG